MLEKIITNPIFIISLVIIAIFIVGLIIAATAHKHFYKTKAKLDSVPNSLNAPAYQILQFGIHKHKQKTQLCLAGEKVEDCYDYINDRIILKEDIFYGNSVSAMAIACHEYGHSRQRYTNSFWFALCHIFQKINSFFSGLFFPLVLLGIIIWLIPFELNIIGKVMIYVGIFSFLITVLLKLFLIPLEFGASNNAKKFLKNEVGIKGKELSQVKELLNSAGMTYVASLFATPYRIIRFIFKGY